MENKTLMTDFYELTMAQSYFDQGKQNEKGSFLEVILLMEDMQLLVV